MLVVALREAMAAEFKGRKVGGEGKVAELDGAYFGGYVRPANIAENRKDRRKLANQSGKRQSLVIIRERDGGSVPAVFKSEGAALAWIKSRIAKGSVVNADEASGWNDLGSKYELRRINQVGPQLPVLWIKPFVPHGLNRHLIGPDAALLSQQVAATAADFIPAKVSRPDGHSALGGDFRRF